MKIKQLVLMLGMLLTVAGCTTTKDKVSSNNSIPSAQKMVDISGQLKERITKVIDVRNGIAYLPNENEPFTGKYETYYPNGQKETEVNYKDGKRNGLDTYWGIDGKKGSEVNYKNGEKDGLETMWKNGHKLLEQNYKDGKRNGLETYWDIDGKKTIEANYKNGEQDGLKTLWIKGQKRSETNYKDGKRNGLDTTWDENGEKISETNYIDGEQKTRKFHSFDYHGIEIKGIHIGMTEKEVTEKIGNVDGFTIAGVKSKFHLDPLNLHYHDGKLDSLTFVFTSEGFDAVLGAVKDKYPSLKCNNSTVSNAMGASFEQMDCMLEDSEAILIIRRFINNIETSMLSLTSQRWLDEKIKHQNDAKKDI